MSFNRTNDVNNAATRSTADIRVETQSAETSIFAEAEKLRELINDARERLEKRTHANETLLATLKRSKEQQLQSAVSTIDAVDSDDEVSEQTAQSIADIDEHAAKKKKEKNDCVRVFAFFDKQHSEQSKKADEMHHANRKAQDLLAKPISSSIISSKQSK